MACQTKETPWKDLATWFDNVSPADQVDWGKWRDILNLAFVDKKLSRRGGWRPWGHWTGASNADLHDQLLQHTWGYEARVPGEDSEVIEWPDEEKCLGYIPPDTGNEPITSVHNHASNDGERRLLVGTQSRIYEQGVGGYWRVLASKLGGSVPDPNVRFRYASLGNLIFATNNVSEPVYYLLDSVPSGCAARNFHPIPDLRTINLVRASVVVKFRATIFFGNVVMDGVRSSHRMVWSNANAGLEYRLVTGSTAGLQDLSPGETILNAVVMGDSMFVFTDEAVWRCTGTASGFVFQRVYHSPDRAGCLLFPHSLAVYAGAAIYVGQGGRIYTYSAYSPAPAEQDWANQCTGELRNIDPKNCDHVSAIYRDDLREYLVSYAKDGAIPNRCLAVDVDSRGASHIDAGFWSLGSVFLRDQETFAEWLVSACLCPAEEVSALFAPAKGEALPLYDPEPPCTAPENEPVYSYNVIPFDSEHEGGSGFWMEDFTNEPYVLSGGVMCERVDFLAPCIECPDAIRIIAASASDGCLKHLDRFFYARSMWTGSGYVNNGYASRLASGAMIFGKSEVRKRISSLALGFDPEPASETRFLQLAVGQSDFPADPIAENCPIRWFELSKKPLECPKEPDAAGFARWFFMVEGRHLYFWIELCGEAETGGACVFTALTAAAGKSPDPIR